MTDIALANCRVLVAEDEVLISMVLEDILDMLGCKLAGSATTLAEATRLAESVPFDVAILDVNLGSDLVYPLAEALADRGVPIIFATGSHPDNLPDRFRGSAVLEKPYAYGAVEVALKQVCGTQDPLAAAG